MGYSFLPATILLPKSSYDLSKWAVVACDQYTSNREYWHKVEETVGDHPSTLKIIYPEVYLNDNDNRIERIQNNMEDYLENVLEESVTDGYVLVSRVTESGNRLGLVGVIDLENYDYSIDSTSPIRATEGTIVSRIPPRQKIRRGATIELPHIMVLVDDIEKKLIEPLYENRDQFRSIYDFDLMQGGGHISGYAIDGVNAQLLSKTIESMEDASNGLFLAMGDGNHSLATAKACWQELKESLTEEEIENHPCRYALVELVNLHSDALIFEPIHRVIFDCDPKQLEADFKAYIESKNMSLLTGDEITFVGSNRYAIDNKRGCLPVDILQTFLDEYVEKTSAEIDYIHGEEDVNRLVSDTTCGILLGAIEKESLFPAIIAGGVLPRKTFSMGEAHEKRYYLECRKLSQ